jgi:hypothetical protein
MNSRTPEVPDERHVVDEPPPFLGTWKRVYAFVLAYLACLIVLMYIFSTILTK